MLQVIDDKSYMSKQCPCEKKKIEKKSTYTLAFH